MTVVVSDTSPLNYLVMIGEIAILHRLYDKVLVPAEVLAELQNDGAPSEVLQWVRSQPDWIEVRRVDIHRDETALNQLGEGERAAILLAQQESDVLLIIDDAAGRAEANRRNIPNTGTLGVLRAAAIRGFVDLPTALARLAATNFRASKSLLDDLVAEYFERKRHLDV
jgi:predicted nucleic acid-binding protein